MNFYLPKRRKKERMNVREDDRIDCPAHLQNVRGYACLIAGLLGHVCQGRIEAHHLRPGSHAGMGRKPGDDRTVPLCSLAHRTLHDMGEAAFEKFYAIVLEPIAARLWLISPAGIRYRKQRESA